MRVKREIIIGSILLLLLVMLAYPTQVASTDSTEPYQPTPGVSGTMTCIARLESPSGQPVWDMTDQPSLFGGSQSIIQPDTGQEVSRLVTGVTMTATGTAINWDTLQMTGRLLFWEYRGNGAGKEFRQVVQDITLSPTATETGVTGTMEFSPVELEPLIPETLTLVYWDYEDGRKVPYTEEYPQKTAESHMMEFTFLALYTVTVEDDYGNLYNDTYTQRIVMSLMWEGSSFDVTLDDGVSDDVPTPTTGDTTYEPPSIEHHADTSTPIDKALHMVWAASASSPDRYEIRINGEVYREGAWAGGNIQLDWLARETGQYDIQVVVWDTAGRSATDTVSVTVYAERDSSVSDPVDPVTEPGVTVTFGRGFDDGDFRAQSLFGGGSGGQLMLFVAVGALVVLWATGRLDPLLRRVERVLRW